MIITHRCLTCSALDIYHFNTKSGNTPGGHELGAPELVATFVDGQVQEHVHKPGTTLNGIGPLCSCPDCKKLYRTVKNDVEPRQPWHATAGAR